MHDYRRAKERQKKQVTLAMATRKKNIYKIAKGSEGRKENIVYGKGKNAG